MIRLLILILLVYLLFRVIRWIRNLSGKFSFSPPNGKFQKQTGRSTPEKEVRILDEMVACNQCGTYHPAGSSTKKKGLYFCNQRCHEAYQKGNPP